MRLSVAVAVACLSIVGLAAADDVRAAMRKPTNIPAESLGTALQQLAKDRNFQIVYVSEEVNALHTAGAVGEFNTEEALKQLLKGTGMTYRYLDERTVTIQPATGPSGASSSELSPAGTPPTSSTSGEPTSEERNATAQRFLLAQVGTAQSSSGSTASSANSQSPEKNTTPLQEVVVTATKREERLQDVPMSLAVIGSQDIDRRGLIGMEDYLRSIPGVNEIDRGASDNAIVIRGITTSPEGQNSASGTTVSTYFGETPITGAGGYGAGEIDIRPVDMQRIEVLRGPQGTTFGDASLGGTMRLIPAKPRLDAVEGQVTGDYSGTADLGGSNSMIQGVLNVPIVTDRLALRLVGYHYDDSGFYRNVGGSSPAIVGVYDTFGLDSVISGYGQTDVGRMFTTGGRAEALFQATDNLDISVTFLSQKIEQNGVPDSDVGVGAYEQTRGVVGPTGRIRNQLGEVGDTNINLANLVLNYSMGWGTLTTVASWVDSGSANAADLTQAFQLPISFTGRSDFNSFTAETRLASHLEGAFQFLGGLFYERLGEHYADTLDWPGPESTNVIGTTPLFLGDIRRRLDQRAVFGEFSYDITDKIKATVGGRYFKYKKDEQDISSGTFGNGGPIGSGVPSELANSEGHSIYKASLTAKPTEGTMLYGSWSQGFRLGHPQTELPASLCDTNNDGLIDGTNIPIASTRQVDSDYLTSYELGGKFAPKGGHLLLDAAVYHITWEGLPIGAFAGGNCPFSWTANAGAATSDGLEMQATVSPIEGLRIDLGGAYNDAKLSRDAVELPGSPPKGSRLPGSPRVSGNLSVQYDFLVADHGAFVRADSFYTGSFYEDLLQTPDTKAGGYTKIDARAGLMLRKNLKCDLFVRNLTNRDSFTFRGAAAGNPGFRLQPRTIGVELGYEFR